MAGEVVTRRKTFDPADVLIAFWRRDDVRSALGRREVGTLFKLYLQAHGDCTQTQLALLTGHDRSDVSNFVRGTRAARVADIDVLTRIADGLQMPDDARVLLGLAPAEPPAPELPSPRSAKDSPSTESIQRIQHLLGIDSVEAIAVARRAGSAVEIQLTLDIDIESSGDSRLTYTHRISNIGTFPLSRIAREVWFKHVAGDLVIEPIDNHLTSTVIHRQHNTPTLVKFACQVSPPISSGTAATITYLVEGGRFVDEFYWRQSTPRYVHDLTIRMRQRGASKLRACTAVEEQADGSERSATEGLRWERDESGIMVTLTRHRLWPNQAVTLRWDTRP